MGYLMSDSTRAMVTDSASDILAVAYCFENLLDLSLAFPVLLRVLAHLFILFN